MTPFLGGVCSHFDGEKFASKTRYQTATIGFSKGFYEGKKIWLENISQKQGTTYPPKYKVNYTPPNHLQNSLSNDNNNNNTRDTTPLITHVDCNTHGAASKIANTGSNKHSTPNFGNFNNMDEINTNRKSNEKSNSNAGVGIRSSVNTITTSNTVPNHSSGPLKSTAAFKMLKHSMQVAVLVVKYTVVWI